MTIITSNAIGTVAQSLIPAGNPAYVAGSVMVSSTGSPYIEVQIRRFSDNSLASGGALISGLYGMVSGTWYPYSTLFGSYPQWSGTYTSMYKGLEMYAKVTVSGGGLSAHGVDYEYFKVTGAEAVGVSGIAVLGIDKLKEEMLIFLRNNLTDPSNRGTIGSDVFTAGGASGNFTLSQKSIKNVTSVTLNGTTLNAYFDYNVDYKNTDPTAFPTITFVNVPASGAVIQTNYNYGETWIYPDFPRPDLTLSSYPRVGFDIISKRSEPFGIGGTAVISDYLLSVTAYADKASTVDSILSQAGSQILANMKNFYHFQFIHPLSTSPLIKDPNREDKIVQRSQDFSIIKRVEK